MFSNRHNQAIFALIIANVIWGAASPIFKYSLTNISPFTLAFLRFFGAMLLLFPFTVNNLWIRRKDVGKLFLLSFFGITISVSFFFLGLRLSPSINAPIIASSGPVFLYLLSIIVLSEKPHPKILIGILISLLGVFTIIGQPLLLQGFNGEIIGNIFFLLATLGSVGHALFSKEIISNYKAVTVTFWSFLIGSLTFFPFFIYEALTLDSLSAINIKGVIGITYGTFFSSALAYFLFEWAVQNLSAQDVGIFTYIDPVAATIIAVPLLKETISPVFLLGSALVFGGILVAEGRLHWHPLHKLRR